MEHCHFPKDFFAIPPMSQAQILERFFTAGNFIHAVTAFGELRAFRAVGQYEPLLYQLQDYELLIRLVKRYPFIFMPEVTLSWRIRGREGNLSSYTPLKSVRSVNEHYLIMRQFFTDLPPALFLKAFGDRFVYTGSRSPAEFACEQAFLYLHHPHMPLCRLLGLEKLYELLRDRDTAEVLHQRFGWGPHTYVDHLQYADILNLTEPHRSFLLVDSGAGLNMAEYAQAVANHGAKGFKLTFDLGRFAQVRSLRWDAMRLRCCTLHLAKVTWLDRHGKGHTLNLDRLTANGSPLDRGGYRFDTLFPMVYLPIEGEVQSVTLEGSWEVQDQWTSAWRLEQLVQESGRGQHRPSAA
jgi:hypothetical protein